MSRVSLNAADTLVCVTAALFFTLVALGQVTTKHVPDALTILSGLGVLRAFITTNQKWQSRGNYLSKNRTYFTLGLIAALAITFTAVLVFKISGNIYFDLHRYTSCFLAAIFVWGSIYLLSKAAKPTPD